MSIRRIAELAAGALLAAGIAMALAAPIPSPAWPGFADPGVGYGATGPDAPTVVHQG